MTDRHFDEELQSLEDELLKMGGITEAFIARSVEALAKGSTQEAQGVIDDDKTVDVLEVDIDEHCMKLLALHQPMASDLRFITTAMTIATELERICDLAVNIAQRVLELSGQPLVKPLIDIPKLSNIARGMVKDSLDAFVHRDPKLARKVCGIDDQADMLRDLVYKELYEIMKQDPTTVSRSIPLLLVARHLERICDHATNIAEEVVYMVEAKFIKHRLDLNELT